MNVAVALVAALVNVPNVGDEFSVAEEYEEFIDASNKLL